MHRQVKALWYDNFLLFSCGRTTANGNREKKWSCNNLNV